MSKINLNDIGSLTNEQSAIGTLNLNSQEIETKSDTFLSRDGSIPNQMEADLDMNSNDILNVGNFTFASGGGIGDVSGPGLSTDEAIVRWDGTTGTLLQNSIITINDSGDLLNPTSINIASTSFDTSIGFFQNLLVNKTAGRASQVLTGFINAETPDIIFANSRATGFGLWTVLQNNDNIGKIQWRGADGGGTTLLGGEINVIVNGVPAVGNLPTRMEFYVRSTTAFDKMLTLTRDGLTFEQVDTFFQFREGSAPASPAANRVRLYAKDVAGVTHLFQKDEAGTEIDLTLGGGGGGTPGGSDTQIQYNNAGAFGGATVTWDNVNLRLNLQDTFFGLRTTGDTNHGIIWDTVVDGPMFRGFAGFRWNTGVAGATERLRLTSTILQPGANDLISLGTSALSFSDLFLADGGVVNWGAGGDTITHTAASDSLTIALDAANALATTQLVIQIDGVSEFVFNGTNFQPGTNDGNTLGISGTAWADLFLASGGVINFNAGNVNLTHSAGILTLSPGDLLVTTAGTAATSVVTRTGTQTLTNKTIDLTSNTLTGTVAQFNTALASADFYTTGGTDVALADGGTGTSLADPNIDVFMGWDDSAGLVKFMLLTDINTEATPASGDFVLMYDAAGNLLKTDWANLPGAGGGAPVGATYVTISLDGTLTSERTLAGGAGLTLTDGGANAAVTLAVGAGTGITVNADDVALTVPVTAVNGGTGQTVYVVGDILTANTTTTLSKLADIATGNALISGGVGVVPSWGKIGISTHVSGLGSNVATWLGTPSSANLIAAVTDETGTGALVFATSPGFTTAANPVSNDGAALGTTALGWSDLFLADGAVVNYGNGGVTGTHTAASDSLTLALDPGNLLASTQLVFQIDGASEFVFTATNFQPGTNDGNTLGISGTAWADLFLATGAVIDFGTANSVITHSTGILTVSTGDLRVTTAGTNTASVVTVGGTQTLTGKSISVGQITGGTALTKTDDTNVTLTLGGAPTTALLTATSLTLGWTGQLSLARGGTGANLVDPNLDRIVMWDDSAATIKFADLASLTTEAAPAAGDFILVQRAEDDIVKVNWSSLPGAGGGISNVVEDTTPELGGDLETNNFSVIFEQYSVDEEPAEAFFHKSRNAAIGSHTIVQDNDEIGALVFKGSNGTTFDTLAAIIAQVDGTPGASADMPGRLVFLTTPDATAASVERLRIDNDGRIINGGASVAYCFGEHARLTIESTTGQTATLLRWQASASGPTINLAKSRGGTVGTYTIVNDDDEIGAVYFWGADGNSFTRGASIVGVVDGTPADGDIPARLSFQTAGGAEGMRIDNSQHVIIGNTDAFASVQELSNNDIANLQMQGTSGSSTTFSVTRWSNDGNPPRISLCKSRSGTVGTHSTVPSSGNDLGAIIFGASDGTNFEPAAWIGAQADGAISSDVVFGRISMHVNNGGTTTAEKFRLQADGWCKIGSSGVPAAPLEIVNNSAATNTVVNIARLSLSSSGTPANGFGTGLEFQTETTADNHEVGARISSVITDTTSTSEDFDLVFETMAAGAAAAERLRIKSDNRIVSPSGAVPHFWVYWTANSTTILASYNMTSIADTAVGDADGTIGVDFSSASWAGFVDTNDATNGWDGEEVQSSGFNARAAGTFGVLCSTVTDGTTAVTSLTDPEQWQVLGMGVSA